MNDCYLCSLFLFANFFFFVSSSSYNEIWNLIDTHDVKLTQFKFMVCFFSICLARFEMCAKEIRRSKKDWAERNLVRFKVYRWFKLSANETNIKEVRNEKIKLLLARRWICFCVFRGKSIWMSREKETKTSSSTKQLRNCSKFWKTDLAHMKITRKTY